MFFRPYLFEMLEKIVKQCDMFIYTSSEKEYADMILKQIDPDDKYFKAKFYKTNCTKAENGLFLKDLEVVRRPITRTVLVDNSSFSFSHQVLNGVPILSYTGSQTDTELMSLLDYLIYLSKSPDVRRSNLEYFKYPVYIDNISQGADTIYSRLFTSQ